MNDHTGAPAAGLNPLRGAWAFARANSLPMVSGALLGLLWANVDLDGYERFTHALHLPWRCSLRRRRSRRGRRFDHAKLGALLSVSAGLLAIAAGRLLGVRRTTPA